MELRRNPLHGAYFGQQLGNIQEFTIRGFKVNAAITHFFHVMSIIECTVGKDSRVEELWYMKGPSRQGLSVYRQHVLLSAEEWHEVTNQ